MKSIGLNSITMKKFKYWVQNNAILTILVFLVILMAALRTDTFFSVRNLLNILRQIAVIGIGACGMTMVMIGGNLDLSIGSLLSLCMVVPIMLQPRGVLFAIVATIIVGFIVGAINGFLIGKLKGNSLIITFGMLSIIQGITFLITGGFYQHGDPESIYAHIGKGFIYKIPIPVILFIVIAFLSFIILSRTVFGRSLYITGGNSYAALASGINTNNIKMLSYIMLGVFVAIGGIIKSSMIDSAQPTAGSGFEFDVITAVVLGGTSLLGGIGTIWGTLIGVILLGVISNSMVLIGLPFPLQLAVKGAILIAAVYYDSFIRGRRFEV